MVREVCRDLIQTLGLQALTAVDGEDALRIARDPNQEITCVLLDLTMPRMNGGIAFDHLRAIRPDLRIILSSGYNEQSTIRQFTSKGLCGFIQKPYTLERLRETLAQVLGQDHRP
jgi:CheY-like chemotaxis protein